MVIFPPLSWYGPLLIIIYTFYSSPFTPCSTFLVLWVDVLSAGAVHRWLRGFLYTGVMSKHYYNSLYNIYPCDFCEYVATSISVLIRPRKG